MAPYNVSTIPQDQTNGESSPSDTPTTCSPTKLKKSWQEDEERGERLPAIRRSSLQLMRPLEECPYPSQPATIADLKDMLLSLKESLHMDMSAMLFDVTTAAQDLSLRVSHAEDKISAMLIMMLLMLIMTMRKKSRACWPN